MKSLFCLGLLAFFDLTNSRSSFFLTNSEEIDSSEHGGPPGRKTTTCPCGWSNKNGLRVVGGKETKVNEYPFAVALIDGTLLCQFCGGTILTENHVLTAAHCTIDYLQKGGSILATVGDHDLRIFEEAPHTQVINVAYIMQHELYDHSNFINDVSILLLERPIIFTERVGPACISYKQLNMDQKTVKVIGWGKTSHDGETSPVLKSVNLRVVPHIICINRFPNMPRDGPRTQLCTHSTQQGACMGDSGGPLVWLDPETNRYTLVGVVSFGRVCASDDPSVFADASAYLPWIQSKITMTTPAVGMCSKI